MGSPCSVSGAPLAQSGRPAKHFERAVETAPPRCKAAAPLNASPSLPLKSPAQCQTKDEVRVELDRIDQALLALFAERHAYVTRVADLKSDPHEAHDPVRIEAIIGRQRARATELGLDDDQAELIWRTLIDWNVNYEKGIIAARRRQQQT